MAPLHIAVSKRRDQMIDVLVQSGADLSVKNNEGQTALELAKSKRFPKCVALLQEAEDKQTRESEAV